MTKIEAFAVGLAVLVHESERPARDLTNKVIDDAIGSLVASANCRTCRAMNLTGRGGLSRASPFIAASILAAAIIDDHDGVFPRSLCVGMSLFCASRQIGATRHTVASNNEVRLREAIIRSSPTGEFGRAVR